MKQDTNQLDQTKTNQKIEERMPKTSNQTQSALKVPLASLHYLKYFGIVFGILALYIAILFYYKYSDDVFDKSLSIGQHIKLCLSAIGSRLYDLFLPLFFFSGALLYRSVRLKKTSLFTALKRDLLVILPLGIILWVYGAFYDEPVKRRFYAMIFEVQQLEPGEKLIQDDATYEIMKAPNLTELNDNIDSLDVQIKDFENRLIDQLATIIPTDQLDEVLGKIDFGTSSIKPSDIRNSSSKWDGIERSNEDLENPFMVSHIDALKKQQEQIRGEINLIHLTPLYIVLFLVFGMLLGYLIPLHKAALTGILIAVAGTWYFSLGMVQNFFNVTYSNFSSFILAKIVFLVVLNAVLMIIANRIYQRTNKAIIS